MTRGLRMFFHGNTYALLISKDRHSKKWTLMSFNYVLASVHWTLADTSARTTRYCTEYRRRRVSHVCMIHTYEVKILV